jgi:hypothetical protein
MVEPMTVRAEHVALFGLNQQLVPWAAERADCKPLGRRKAVMEIEGRRGTDIRARAASTSTHRNELRLQLATTLLLVPVRLRVATSPSVRNQLIGGEIPRWSLRCVVDPEGRAREAEPSAIEKSDLAVNRLFGREEPSASLAAKLLCPAMCHEARAATRSERQTIETLLPTVEMALFSEDSWTI